MWSLLLIAVLAAEGEAIPRNVQSQDVQSTEKATDAEAAKGYLVAVGGGTTTIEIVEKVLKLAKGADSKVVIIPEANREYGASSLAAWKTVASRAVMVTAEKPGVAVKLLNDADVIWMPGGLQGVFMNAIRGTEIPNAIRKRYREGGIVGGTSAGAAVMCRVMIGGQSDLESLKAGTAPYLTEGLALWPEVIIDQHFLQKARFNRLALAVIDHPNLVGIGIDEQTAAVVHGRSFEVIGRGNVTVIDSRKATREKLVKGEPAASRNMTVHIMRAGMKFHFDEPDDK